MAGGSFSHGFFVPNQLGAFQNYLFKLDSIAVSVFVLVLVEFDKY